MTPNPYSRDLISPRIETLRAASVSAPETLSAERAELLTRFYREGKYQSDPAPIQRARAFEYLLVHKKLYIGEGELIVGERGPAPKATPTYPEICIHSLDDLDIISGREKVSFAVSPETRDLYESDIIPFWSGKSLRESLMKYMDEDWKAAYAAGVFTEFQEQRSPGHTVLGDIIYHKGLLDLQADIRAAMEKLDYYEDPSALDHRHQLEAMDIAADAMMAYAARYAEALRKEADLCGSQFCTFNDPHRAAELRYLADICDRVPARAPQTFHEALQYYWFVHIGVIIEANPWDSFNPGRLDQHLIPFYRKELAAGTLTREKAKELLCAFWIKFNNHPAPPKTGVTAQESNTYTDFALINIGGVTRTGADGVNEVSEIILEVIGEMRLLQPSSMVQVSKKNPDRFLKMALDITRSGFGQPSFFNTEAIIQELVRQGKDVEDARCGGASGCVESGAFGKEAYFLTGYMNLVKILEITLHRGIDPRTGNRLGPDTGDPADYANFDELMAAFRTQVNHFINIKIRGNNIIERLHARMLPVPFLSLFIDDCIANGRDYTEGGARYNTSYIQGVGLGTITDSLSALRHHVFRDEKEGAVPMSELLAALSDDFQGYDDLRRRLKEDTPRYGNDDDAADEIMQQVFEIYYEAVNGRPNSRGGVHRINLLPTTVHVYFGGVIGATPDGRLAGTPLSEGISPVQGADRNGPTAVVKSASKIDHIRTGGTLLNQKFLPKVLEDAAGITGVSSLIRAYFRMDGHHIQFNVVDAETLKKAQAAPDDYRDLIVRVAGYSDYFVDLTPELQEEIILRTAHEGV